MRYLVAAILFFVLFFYSCNPVTERILEYEVHGIDVSHYQSNINWDSIVAQNISFAFVKATEGETFEDSLYSSNWPEMKRVGIKRGAYHFFRPSLSVYKQAKNFIDNVRLEIGDLPPVLDVEVDDGASEELVVFRIKTWLEMIEHHYKVTPIIYTNISYFNKFIAGNLDEYPIWIARYSYNEPQLAFNKQWDFWQYGNRGRLNGIEGDVDFNVFNGNHEQLASFCISKDPSLSIAIED
jgi:lysozyme